MHFFLPKKVCRTFKKIKYCNEKVLYIITLKVLLVSAIFC
jgi:hypothetical protein